MIANRLVLVAVVGAGLAGCAGHRGVQASPTEIFETPAKSCYVTDSGVEILNDDSWCPSRRVVEKEVGKLLRRTGAPEGALAGARVVFTRAWIDCGGVTAWGCSGVDVSMVRMVADHPRGRIRFGSARTAGKAGLSFAENFDDWRTVLTHELGHVLRERAGIGIDRFHADAGWWEVTGQMRRETPAFDPGSKHAVAIQSILSPVEYDYLRIAQQESPTSNR